jgi:hypothetical protein
VGDADAHLAVEDRSWWPQIAMQLELEPIERVRRLTPAGAADVAGALELLAAVDPPAIVIGEIAGALHGWPLVLDATAIEVCVVEVETVADALGANAVNGDNKLADGVKLMINEVPPGTFGFRDLGRSAEAMQVGTGSVRVAALLDLLRIAEASSQPTPLRDALAFQAVLDVERARSVGRPADDRTAEERVDAWLSRQTPAA